MKTGKVSQRIKDYMKKREMDLDQLSQLTGLEVSFLNTMLTQNIFPPLGPLMKIARALGVRLGTFLDDQDSQDPFIVRRMEREADIHVQGTTGKAAALKFFSLGRGKTDRHMEPFFVEIHPESRSEKTLSSHEGEEFIVVQSGSIEIIYGKETYRLSEGDSVYYNSIVPHYVSCIGDEKADILAVIYIPN